MDISAIRYQFNSMARSICIQLFLRDSLPEMALPFTPIKDLRDMHMGKKEILQ